MKKLFTIFVVTILVVSCTRSYDEVTYEMKSAKSTAISKEQALKNLYGELKLLDGATRADGKQRTVKNIKPLKGAVTRSGKPLADDLLYIVEFAEGEGSAVLAADTRLNPVIAVLDSSVLTEEDFASEDEEDINTCMASLIASYAERSSTREGLIPALGFTVYDTIIHTQKLPMLKTKWHQGSPFNDKCIATYTTGATVAAGCAAIAMDNLYTITEVQMW